MPPHLYKRKNRPSWYIKDGDRLISLKTTRKGYAEEKLRDYDRKRLGIYRVPRKKMSVYIEPYLEHCRQFNKPATVEDKKRTLGFFRGGAGDPLIGQITHKTIQTYLTGRRAKGLSAERWNTERQVLGNFFRYLMFERVIDVNPSAQIRKQKVVRSKIPKALTREAERQLLAWLKASDPELWRMAVLVGNTGLRVRELANLIWKDIDFKRRLLFVTAKSDWTPKDYEERAIPLNRTALGMLKRQKIGNGGSPYVFPRQDGKRYGRGLDLRMVRAFKPGKAGLGKGGFHNLRHTYATRAIMAGMDLETLRKIMGHADTKTLQKYLHVNPEHVKRAAEKVRFGG